MYLKCAAYTKLSKLSSTAATESETTIPRVLLFHSRLPFLVSDISMSHTLQIHWQSYGWLQCKFDLCSVTEVNVAHRHLQVCLFVLDILSPGAKLTSSFYHLEARSSVSAGLERTSLCEWIHVIPDKHHPHPTPPLLPSPLEGWTCVSWCRSSSVPADYSMSYDSMGTAAVGIRQAAGPHLQPPPSSTGPPSSALLVRDWSQPLYQGWVILELGLSLTTSPLFTLSISWRLEWMFHCCTRVIATCYQEGNTNQCDKHWFASRFLNRAVWQFVWTSGSLQHCLVFRTAAH